MLSKKRKTARTSLRFEVIDGKFRRYPDGREVCIDTEKGKAEYRERTMSMRARQLGICLECNHWMDEHETTFDHEDLRGMGGARRDDRIAVGGVWTNRAVHLKCNSERGSRRS